MSDRAAAAAALDAWLTTAAQSDPRVTWTQDDASYVVTLPGERKQLTTVSVVVGQHAVTIQAFVARHPDENEAGVHRWLLERNRRAYVVAYCIDQHGDVYLSGRLPHHAVTEDELDRVMGAVLDATDGAFNTLLELGFATSIRREWAWRLARGEPTANLTAFAHLAPHERDDGPGSSGRVDP